MEGARTILMTTRVEPQAWSFPWAQPRAQRIPTCLPLDDCACPQQATMLSAFTARPIVELKPRDKSRIESILAYGATPTTATATARLMDGMAR